MSNPNMFHSNYHAQVDYYINQLAPVWNMPIDSPSLPRSTQWALGNAAGPRRKHASAMHPFDSIALSLFCTGGEYRYTTTAADSSYVGEEEDHSGCRRTGPGRCRRTFDVELATELASLLSFQPAEMVAYMKICLQPHEDAPREVLCLPSPDRRKLSLQSFRSSMELTPLLASALVLSGDVPLALTLRANATTEGTTVAADTEPSLGEFQEMLLRTAVNYGDLAFVAGLCGETHSGEGKECVRKGFWPLPSSLLCRVSSSSSLSITATGQHHLSLVDLAIQQDHPSVLRWLLRRTALPAEQLCRLRSVSHPSQTLLHEAIRCGSYSSFFVFLQYLLDNASCSGITTSVSTTDETNEEHLALRRARVHQILYDILVEVVEGDTALNPVEFAVKQGYISCISVLARFMAVSAATRSEQDAATLGIHREDHTVCAAADRDEMCQKKTQQAEQQLPALPLWYRQQLSKKLQQWINTNRCGTGGGGGGAYCGSSTAGAFDADHCARWWIAHEWWLPPQSQIQDESNSNCDATDETEGTRGVLMRPTVVERYFFK